VRYWLAGPPAEFGPWQTVWKRHRRFASDGTWDRIHAGLLGEADAAGQIDWTVSVDSTITAKLRTNTVDQNVLDITWQCDASGRLRPG